MKFTLKVLNFSRTGMERYELKVEHIGLRWGERLAGATTQAMETRRPYVQQVTRSDSSMKSTFQSLRRTTQ